MRDKEELEAQISELKLRLQNPGLSEENIQTINQTIRELEQELKY